MFIHTPLDTVRQKQQLSASVVAIYTLPTIVLSPAVHHHCSSSSSSARHHCCRVAVATGRLMVNRCCLRAPGSAVWPQWEEKACVTLASFHLFFF